MDSFDATHNQQLVVQKIHTICMYLVHVTIETDFSERLNIDYVPS